jgi:hypothetical protein
MNHFTNVLKALPLIILLGFAVSCDEEDEIFEAPTISVVADNTTPFADEDIIFTVQVIAPGGLKQVTLDGQVIKSYSSGEKEDQFQHVVTLPSNVTFGNRSFEFEVTDNQGSPRSESNSVSVEVKNPAERGNPLMIAKFDVSVYPSGKVSSVSTAMQNQGWGDFFAGEFAFGTDNVITTNTNKVLKYKKTNTWGWEQYVGFDIDLINAAQISEDEWEALAAGERVLQVNVYFQHVPQINDQGGNDSQIFPANGGYIPIEGYIGDKEKWGFVNGVNVGRRIWLKGKLTANETWQTVTLTAFNPDENDLPGDPKDIDATVGFDQIDRVSISCNPGGFQRKADDTKVYNGGFSPPFDHNNYFFYNLRLIDTSEKDNNPNL